MKHCSATAVCFTVTWIAVAAGQAPTTQPTLEIVARLPRPTPGNIAVTPAGRKFVSLHPFGTPDGRVVELLPDGTTRPFPNAAWSKAVGSDGVGIASIIGIKSDPKGVVWMLDAGDANSPPKLVAWDTVADKLQRVIHIPPPASCAASFIQELALDSAHGQIYLADCGIGAGFEHPRPALVVVDLATGTSRRVLENHPSVQAEDVPMMIDGRVVTVAGPDGKPLPARVGVNPLTIDAACEWVYYGAMHGRTVYKVRAADLADVTLSAGALGQRVQRHGEKGISDGFSIDSAGNIYVTDVTHHAIGVLEAGGGYRLFIQNPALSWPDGMSGGPDGYFYVVINQLERHARLNGGVSAETPPFLIARFKPLAPAIVGR